MTGQLSLFDQTDAKFDPLRETATRARPCWTTSAKTLVDLCSEDPDIERWTEAVKNEYCPNGFVGHLGADEGPGTLIGWELRTKNVMIKYFDKDGDLEMGKAIICNAKTRRVSVCNALDTLLVHEQRLGDLAELVKPLHDHKVMLYADAPAYQLLTGHYPDILLQPTTEESFDTEFMDYKMNVVTVSSLDEALAHIDQHGSGHSEAIITQNEQAARQFQQHVDAACVYWNAPTSFTDGAQFGLGAEIGISTQKLGPRGPMALEEITTYKWIIEGEGQVRS